MLITSKSNERMMILYLPSWNMTGLYDASFLLLFPFDDGPIFAWYFKERRCFHYDDYFHYYITLCTKIGIWGSLWKRMSSCFYPRWNCCTLNTDIGEKKSDLLGNDIDSKRCHHGHGWKELDDPFMIKQRKNRRIGWDVNNRHGSRSSQ